MNATNWKTVALIVWGLEQRLWGTLDTQAQSTASFGGSMKEVSELLEAQRRYDVEWCDQQRKRDNADCAVGELIDPGNNCLPLVRLDRTPLR